jgi:DNA polymerase-3 subunit epsilon
MTLAGYRKLVFIDLESTGAHPVQDAITEIGIVEVADGEVTRWSTLVNPELPIPPFVQKLTGITDDMVREAPLFRDLMNEVRARLDGALFIAHNARFDYGFLRNAFRRCGESIRCDVLDTIKLSRKFFPGEARHSLDALIERHSLPADARHRALADAEVLWEFWCKLQEIIEPDVFHAAVRELLRKPHLPPHIDPEVFDDLPDGPGVYVFYGENDVALHVGRAAQLRARVLTHLHSEAPSPKDALLMRETRRIECRETAGEIGPQLLESQLIRMLRPLHVPARDKPRDAWSWHIRSTPPLAVLTSTAAADFGADGTFHGLFNSEKKADMALRALAEKHRLCLATLGIQDESSHQCPNCQEPYALQRRRLEAALHSIKLQQWPCDGAAGMVETSTGGKTEIHIIANWNYVATARSANELHAIVAKLSALPVFDADTYKIVTHALSAGKARLIPLSECEAMLPASTTTDRDGMAH